MDKKDDSGATLQNFTFNLIKVVWKFKSYESI